MFEFDIAILWSQRKILKFTSSLGQRIKPPLKFLYYLYDSSLGNLACLIKSSFLKYLLSPYTLR